MTEHDIVQESRLVKRVEPVCPEALRQARIQGEVHLVVEIDEEGFVERIRISSGHPLPAIEAAKAVLEWQYSACFLNGEPVPVIASVTVGFI